MLTVYFDTAKSDVTDDLASAAANDELSKKRVQAVGKALEVAGIPATSIELVKPNETTDTSGDNTAARRVDVVVKP